MFGPTILILVIWYLAQDKAFEKQKSLIITVLAILALLWLTTRNNNSRAIVGASAQSVKYGDEVTFFVSTPQEGGLTRYLLEDDQSSQKVYLRSQVGPPTQNYKWTVLDKDGQATGKEWRFGDQIRLQSGKGKWLVQQSCDRESFAGGSRCKSWTQLALYESFPSGAKGLWRFISPTVVNGQMSKGPVTLDSYGQFVNVESSNIITAMRDTGNTRTHPEGIADARPASFFKVRSVTSPYLSEVAKDIPVVESGLFGYTLKPREWTEAMFRTHFPN